MIETKLWDTLGKHFLLQDASSKMCWKVIGENTKPSDGFLGWSKSSWFFVLIPVGGLNLSHAVNLDRKNPP